MRTITIPIVEDAASHAAALERVRELWGAPEGSHERAEMDALVTLVARYEEESDPWPDLPPQEIVLGIMDSHGLSQADLVPAFGSKSQISDFLSGRRPMSLAQALRLREAYGVPLELLLAAR